jgi:ribosomal protein L12E/L44/L45/RPP1/RPP2
MSSTVCPCRATPWKSVQTEEEEKYHDGDEEQDEDIFALFL